MMSFYVLCRSALIDHLSSHQPYIFTFFMHALDSTETISIHFEGYRVRLTYTNV